MNYQNIRFFPLEPVRTHHYTITTLSQKTRKYTDKY